MILQLNDGDELEVADELTNEGKLACRVVLGDAQSPRNTAIMRSYTPYIFLSPDDMQRLAGHLLGLLHEKKHGI